MVVLCMVLVAHFLGDWVVQTDHQAAEKIRSWRAMHEHCLGYHLLMAILVIPFWPDWRSVVLLAISYSTHALIDRRWPVRWLMRKTGSHFFATQPWGVIATDQALHLSILLSTVGLLDHFTA